MPFYIEVCLPVPLRTSFVYLPLSCTKPEDYAIGARVQVPFGKGNKYLIGIISNIISKYKADFELKEILKIIDSKAIVTDKIIRLINFANKYYHHPLGEIYFSCLPALIKQGRDLEQYSDKLVFLNADPSFLRDKAKLTPAQIKLIDIIQNSNNKNSNLIKEYSSPISIFALNQLGIKNSTINSLLKNDYIIIKNNIKKNEQSTITSKSNILCSDLHKLNQEQQLAVNTVLEQSHNLCIYISFLLYGITGSGKTEVYFYLIYQSLLQNKQVLLLVPEISLTPQTINRFKSKFKVSLAVIHSKVSIKSKTQDWLAAKNGEAKIVIGTRSAIFTPMSNLGLIIVDEEHDQSFKQQESFKYNGRDLAVIRAKQDNIPIVLGTATPSIESVANVIYGKYSLLTLKSRAGDAQLPNLSLLNIKHKKLDAGLSPELIKLIQSTLKKNQQVLLFLNRRGFAPVLKCHDCDWGAICERCQVYYTIHKQEKILSCHYCNKTIKIINNCQECGSLDLGYYGIGTEQIELTLKNLFKKHQTIRIDRDTVKSDKDLINYLKIINNDEPKILLGTQMLAKGHHFPNVTLVAVVDADSSLFSTDFRAPERLTQLLLQVAGRAGRGDKSGQVVIQTSQPEHKLLQDILHKDYWDIALDLYNMRKMTHLPPYSQWAIIRAESLKLNTTMDFLNNVKSAIDSYLCSKNTGHKKINIIGPTPSQRFKKAGLYRGHLIVSTLKKDNNLTELQEAITNFLNYIDNIKVKNVKWSLDIDPYDVY